MTTRKKDLTFGEARARLDEILAEVENEGGDVDQLAARVREAAELIRFCRDRLSAARAQVTQVVAELAAVEQSVAQDASQWNLTDINRRAERLLEQSATAVERVRALEQAVERARANLDTARSGR